MSCSVLQLSLERIFAKVESGRESMKILNLTLRGQDFESTGWKYSFIDKYTFV